MRQQMERAHAARQHRTRRARARPRRRTSSPGRRIPPFSHLDLSSIATDVNPRRFSSVVFLCVRRLSDGRSVCASHLLFPSPSMPMADGAASVPGIAYNQAAADPPPRMTQRVRASVSYACAAQLPHAESDRARLHHLSWQGRAHLALISITRQSPWRRRRRPWRPSARPHWSRRGSSHQSCPGRGPPLGR